MGTSPDFNDVIRLGVQQSKFDPTAVTSKSDLFYVGSEQTSIIFYVQAPVLLHAPFAKSSNSLLSVATFVATDPSNDNNIKLFELKIEFTCPLKDKLYGVPLVEMTLNFEGCPSYLIYWQKSCGNDKNRKFCLFVIDLF